MFYFAGTAAPFAVSNNQAAMAARSPRKEIFSMSFQFRLGIGFSHRAIRAFSSRQPYLCPTCGIRDGERHPDSMIYLSH